MVEVFHLMQLQSNDMELLLRHGTEAPGRLQVRIGRITLLNVDSRVIQIIHGIEIHVKQIQDHKTVLHLI